jgi:putative addiction module CopG family antidote
MENVVLPPELERFATEAVAAGRYRDFSDVVAAGIGMLREAEDARARLLQSVQAAERNGELNGFLTLDEVMEDADAVIAEMAGLAK